MSEFSESYHLRAVQPQRGEDLLRAAGAHGFVYPQANGWVTVLAEGEPFQFDPRLLPANQGGLLYYWCAEDQGWGFVACWNDRVVSRYERTWDDEIWSDDSELDLPALRAWLERVGVEADLERSLPEILYPDEADGFSASPAHSFAKLLGLKNFEWLSYDYIANEFDEDDMSFKGVVQVRWDDTVNVARQSVRDERDSPDPG